MGMYDTIECELPCLTKGCKGICVNLQTKAFGCGLNFFKDILPIHENSFYDIDRSNERIFIGLADCNICDSFYDWNIHTDEHGKIMRFMPKFR